jgi:hypothetical protein
MLFGRPKLELSLRISKKAEKKLKQRNQRMLRKYRQLIGTQELEQGFQIISVNQLEDIELDAKMDQLAVDTLKAICSIKSAGNDQRTRPKPPSKAQRRRVRRARHKQTSQLGVILTEPHAAQWMGVGCMKAASSEYTAVAAAAAVAYASHAGKSVGESELNAIDLLEAAESTRAVDAAEAVRARYALADDDSVEEQEQTDSQQTGSSHATGGQALHELLAARRARTATAPAARVVGCLGVRGPNRHFSLAVRRDHCSRRSTGRKKKMD